MTTLNLNNLPQLAQRQIPQEQQQAAAARQAAVQPATQPAPMAPLAAIPLTSPAQAITFNGQANGHVDSFQRVAAQPQMGTASGKQQRYDDEELGFAGASAFKSTPTEEGFNSPKLSFGQQVAIAFSSVAEQVADAWGKFRTDVVRLNSLAPNLTEAQQTEAQKTEAQRLQAEYIA